MCKIWFRTILTREIVTTTEKEHSLSEKSFVPDMCVCTVPQEEKILFPTIFPDFSAERPQLPKEATAMLVGMEGNGP